MSRQLHEIHVADVGWRGSGVVALWSLGLLSCWGQAKCSHLGGVGCDLVGSVNPVDLVAESMSAV